MRCPMMIKVALSTKLLARAAGKAHHKAMEAGKTLTSYMQYAKHSKPGMGEFMAKSTGYGNKLKKHINQRASFLRNAYASKGMGEPAIAGQKYIRKLDRTLHPKYLQFTDDRADVKRVKGIYRRLQRNAI